MKNCLRLSAHRLGLPARPLACHLIFTLSSQHLRGDGAGATPLPCCVGGAGSGFCAEGAGTKKADREGGSREGVAYS